MLICPPTEIILPNEETYVGIEMRVASIDMFPSDNLVHKLDQRVFLRDQHQERKRLEGSYC